jgi:hypothetical protein
MKIEDLPFITYEQLLVLRLEVGERLAKQMTEEERFKYVSEHIMNSLPLTQTECMGMIIRSGGEELLDKILKEILGENYEETAEKLSDLRRKEGLPPP